MNVVNCTSFSENFTSIANQVCDDHAPIIVTCRGKQPVVVMSEEDYRNIEKFCSDAGKPSQIA